MATPQRLALAAAALVFVCLHALTVPRTLEDEDSINLALGVEAFDLELHAPHPPGYPVYVVLGKVSTAAAGWLRPDWSRDRRAAAGLAWLSILSGALGIFAFAALWRGLGVSAGWSTLAAVATAAAPLYWFTAARPLTDTPGLVAAVAIQAAFLHGLRRLPDQPTLPVSWIAASLAAGLAIGLRSQTLWLTLPALIWAMAALLRRRRPAQCLIMAGAALAGVLIWFLPLIYLTGGFNEYRYVVLGQARGDIKDVQMLATHPSWALLKDALAYTFLEPWRLLGVPWLVVAAAALGVLQLAARRLWHLPLLAVLIVPYLAFHLLFHEVETLRYALPTSAMAAGLAVIALGFLGSRAGGVAAVAAAAAAVAVVHPVTASYAAGSPIFHVVEEMRSVRATMTGAAPRLEAHNGAWWVARRALYWNRDQWDLGVPRFVRRDESLRLVDYWLSGATAPIWFLSDPDRGDLARFDPASARPQRTHRFSADVAALIGGLRRYEVGWWRLLPPAWMLGRGWAVSHELAHESADPHSAVAFLRRDAPDTMLFVGARHVTPSAGPVEMSARLDGREIDRWVLEPDGRRVRWIRLPPVAPGPDAYATFSVSALSARGDERLVSFDQFGAAPATAPMVALGRGWSGVERDPAARAEWRVVSGRSEIRVRHAGRPVRLTIRGHVPEFEFAVRPTAAIFAGAELLTTSILETEFELSLEPPPDVLDAAGGTITMVVDWRRSLEERQRGLGRRESVVRVTGVEIAEAGQSQ